MWKWQWLVVVSVLCSQEGYAQQQWNSDCRIGLMGTMECNHREVPQNNIQFDSSPPPDINGVFDPLSDTANGIAQGTINQMQQWRADDTARQLQQDTRADEARRAMIADPENAELIADMYGVEISPQTRRYLDALRAQRGQ